jgi:chromosome segregation ATPase
MFSRPRRTTMRPVREFDCVLRARDQQVSTLNEQSTVLKAQLETTERRLTNARANAHADARAYQLQERKIEQLRMKLRDIRGGSAAQRRELEDVKRESEVLKTQLAEAREESAKHLTRIAELEEASSQEVSQPAPTQSLDFDGVSHDDILDALVQATIGLEALAKVSEEDTSPGHSPDSTSWSTAHVDGVEIGIQTFFDENTKANHCRGCHRELQDAEDVGHLISQLRAASERDQCRIRDLEVDIEHGHRLIEELRTATEEERRLVWNFKASSVQAQSRVMSLEDAARQDQRAIEALEATVETYRSEIESLEAELVLLRALLDESRAFSDDLEEDYDSIIQCKDAFIQDLREKIEDLAASEAWDQHREAAIDDIQEKLEASEVEILELRAELEGAPAKRRRVHKSDHPPRGRRLSSAPPTQDDGYREWGLAG